MEILPILMLLLGLLLGLGLYNLSAGIPYRQNKRLQLFLISIVVLVLVGLLVYTELSVHNSMLMILSGALAGMLVYFALDNKLPAW